MAITAFFGMEVMLPILKEKVVCPLLQKPSLDLIILISCCPVVLGKVIEKVAGLQRQNILDEVIIFYLGSSLDNSS